MIEPELAVHDILVVCGGSWLRRFKHFRPSAATHAAAVPLLQPVKLLRVAVRNTLPISLADGQLLQECARLHHSVRKRFPR